jgi:hypothetical protein
MRIAVNMKPVSGPWGGGNQFVTQLVRHLRGRGHRVSFRLWPWTERILLVAPRPFQHVTFGTDEIRRFKARHPSARCIHRINQTNLGRGSTTVDGVFQQANEVADLTVFVSMWVRNYFTSKWFDPRRPHLVIHNGADPSLFYPAGHAWTPGDGTCRIVTHHWSDNWNKGFAVYQQVDRLIADGHLPGFALTVVGRWPQGLDWRAAATLPPLPPAEVGAELRRHHLYLTAAVAEAGANHPIEAVQCGLPLVYHEDGGSIAETGRTCGVAFRDDVRAALLSARERYPELRGETLRDAPSGVRMCQEYERVIVE